MVFLVILGSQVIEKYRKGQLLLLLNVTVGFFFDSVFFITLRHWPISRRTLYRPSRNPGNKKKIFSPRPSTAVTMTDDMTNYCWWGWNFIPEVGILAPFRVSTNTYIRNYRRRHPFAMKPVASERRWNLSHVIWVSLSISRGRGEKKFIFFPPGFLLGR
jgi:hypothetical protein